MAYNYSSTTSRDIGKEFYIAFPNEVYEYLVDDLQAFIRDIARLTSSIIDEEANIKDTLILLTNSVFFSVLIPTGSAGSYLQGVELDESSTVNITSGSRLGIIRLTGSNLVSSTGDQTDFTTINGENVTINNLLNISDVINISNNTIESLVDDLTITVNNGNDIRFVGDVEITGTTTFATIPEYIVPDPVITVYLLDTQVISTEDRGLELMWNNTSNQTKSAFMGFDVTEKKFKFYSESISSVNASNSSYRGNTFTKTAVTSMDLDYIYTSCINNISGSDLSINSSENFNLTSTKKNTIDSGIDYNITTSDYDISSSNETHVLTGNFNITNTTSNFNSTTVSYTSNSLIFDTDNTSVFQTGTHNLSYSNDTIASTYPDFGTNSNRLLDVYSTQTNAGNITINNDTISGTVNIITPNNLNITDTTTSNGTGNFNANTTINTQIITVNSNFDSNIYSIHGPDKTFGINTTNHNGFTVNVNGSVRISDDSFILGNLTINDDVTMNSREISIPNNLSFNNLFHIENGKINIGNPGSSTLNISETTNINGNTNIGGNHIWGNNIITGNNLNIIPNNETNINSNQFYFNNLTKNMGIGTTNTSHGFTVNGDAYIDGNTTVTGTTIISGNILLNSEKINIPNNLNINNNLFHVSNNSLGIGTVPETPLHINDENKQLCVYKNNFFIKYLTFQNTNTNIGDIILGTIGENYKLLYIESVTFINDESVIYSSISYINLSVNGGSVCTNFNPLYGVDYLINGSNIDLVGTGGVVGTVWKSFITLKFIT